MQRCFFFPVFGSGNLAGKGFRQLRGFGKIGLGSIQLRADTCNLLLKGKRLVLHILIAGAIHCGNIGQGCFADAEVCGGQRIPGFARDGDNFIGPEIGYLKPFLCFRRQLNLCVVQESFRSKRLRLFTGQLYRSPVQESGSFQLLGLLRCQFDYLFAVNEVIRFEILLLFWRQLYFRAAQEGRGSQRFSLFRGQFYRQTAGDEILGSQITGLFRCQLNLGILQEVSAGQLFRNSRIQLHGGTSDKVFRRQLCVGLLHRHGGLEALLHDRLKIFVLSAQVLVLINKVKNLILFLHLGDQAVILLIHFAEGFGRFPASTAQS